jgi:hypothetical protein
MSTNPPIGHLPDELKRDGHAANCDGPDDWHHPITGHCGDCGCFTCSAER